MHTYKRLFFFFLVAIGLQTKAQVTLQHTYSTPSGGANFQFVYLKYSGFKYVYFNGTDSMMFYNLNYSLYKTIVIPGSWTNPNIMFISEGLFDTDSTHIDYLLEAYNGVNSFSVYKDNGSLIYNENSASVVWTTNGMSLPVFSPIFSSDSGTFMIVSKEDSFGAEVNTEIYKLGGTLPCIPGCANGTSPLGIESMSSGSIGYSAIYPNPATNYTDIYYKLPVGNNTGEIVLYDMTGREIKRYSIDRRFDHLHITTSDVSAGTYFYQLTSNGQSISAKKLIVVK
ncbi:MAG TPA: T9SS type A sorting domain-containing protein [Bacteroidia bacterium]|jgi:hypothetical protein|nr:T9SS type A sorting domain-containing protein [Bacteroidia bacterium]